MGGLVRAEDRGFTGDPTSLACYNMYSAISVSGMLLIIYYSVDLCFSAELIDLNRKNKGGWNALMYASYIGSILVFDILQRKAKCGEK